MLRAAIPYIKDGFRDLYGRSSSRSVMRSSDSLDVDLFPRGTNNEVVFALP